MTPTVASPAAIKKAPRRAFGVQIRKAVPMPRMPPSAIPTATVGCCRRSRSGSLEGRTHEPLNGKLTAILLEALRRLEGYKKKARSHPVARHSRLDAAAICDVTRLTTPRIRPCARSSRIDLRAEAYLHLVISSPV